MLNKFTNFLFSLCVLSEIGFIEAVHLKDTWKTDSFFLFLAKFGVQKTDTKRIDITQGFVYGNITTKDKFKNPVTLVLVESEFFMEFYGNATLKNEICSRMFNKIDTIAYDSPCKPKGREDFLRRIPCPDNMLCVDEDDPSNLLPGYQFTFKIKDLNFPRFWYMSLVSCYRSEESNCTWVNNKQEGIEIDYDIWLVNGDPRSKHLNPFEHQFSFEEFDTFESYFIFLMIYIFVLLLWIYVYSTQKHALTRLLTSTICFEFIGVALNLVHVSVFAANGQGVIAVSILGNAIDAIAQCLFMLCLLLIAKGWTITHLQIKGRGVVFIIWGIYTFLNCVLFIWNLTEVDAISNIDEWQTWPGYLTCAFRLIIMVWFVIELRRTFQNSRSPDRLHFLQQFGAYFLVWFIYIPLLAIISTQFSALWKRKTILNITSAADLLSYLVLLHLLWPSRSILYLLKERNPVVPPFELEITGLLDDQEDFTLFNKEKMAKAKHNKRTNNNTAPNGLPWKASHRMTLDDENELPSISEEEVAADQE